MIRTLRSSRWILNTRLNHLIQPHCRTFFSLPFSQQQQQPQEHQLQRILNYRPELLYSIVADVDSYDKFLPYCLESKITSFDKKTSKPSRAILKVGWQQFEESFESKLKYTESSVVAEAANPQMFNELYTKWTVRPVKGNDHKCVVDFALRFSFNNPLYNSVSSNFGPSIASMMVQAFQDRAEELENRN